MNQRKFFTGNQLKTIAAITMVIDHVGAYLLPQFEILRIIGRISFPIFGYMIAEGCEHTKNRKRYLVTMALLAVVFQIMCFLIEGSLKQCIFVTLSLSVSLCFLYQKGVVQNNRRWLIFGMSALSATYLFTEILPRLLPVGVFSVDYGFCGVMLPVVVFVCKRKHLKLCAMAVMLILIALDYGYLQWYSFAALPLVALYNGKRGSINLKYFFYVFYPAHLVIIYFVGLLWK